MTLARSIARTAVSGLVDELEVRLALKRKCESIHGLSAFSHQCGLMPTLLTEMIEGRLTLSDRVCEALGFSRVTMFKPKP